MKHKNDKKPLGFRSIFNVKQQIQHNYYKHALLHCTEVPTGLFPKMTVFLAMAICTQQHCVVPLSGISHNWLCNGKSMQTTV
jgi:hypothetical protein